MPKEENIVCLGIGSGRISFLEAIKFSPVKNIPSSIQIVRYNSQDISENLEEGLTSYLGAIKGKRSKIRCSLGGQDTVIRFVDMPKMSYSDFKSALKFEVDKYMPFPVEEVYFDGDILAESEQNMKVVIVAAKKNLINKILKVFEENGVVPESLELDNISLINLYTYYFGSEYRNDTVCLLNISEIYSSINIIENNIPVLSRIINIGKDYILKQVGTKGDTSIEESSAARSSISQLSIDTAANLFQDFFHDIRMTLDYYEVQSGKRTQKIILTGMGSDFESLDKIMEKGIGADTEFLKVSDSLNFSSSTEKEDFSKQERFFHICLGSLLR